MEWARICPASPVCNGAMRAKWRHETPIRRACEKNYWTDWQMTACSWNSVDQPAGDRRIGIDPPVAQEWPVAAGIFQHAHINFSQHNFFFVVGGLSEHAAKRISEERASPEFETFA